MRRVLLLICVLFVCRCGPPIPPPSSPPATPPPPPREAAESVIGTVRVTASALNVRRGPSTGADAITQVRRGTVLSVLESGESWTRVRLPNGETGWVASRFVSSGNAPSTATAARRRSGCPPDSDFAFIETPTPAFSDRDAHGLVVVEATVSASGNVTATRVVSNTTGDDALAALTEREIRGAKFSPPIRNCVPRSFIFTYRRTF